MTGDGFVQEAVDELYAADPEEFVARRGALAAQARAAGDAPAAKRISALRKPTRSAWVINQLVRCEPGATAQLSELGEELRHAQEALDGAAIRELSQRRRQLVDSLTQQALAVSGQQSPPAALREEVTATLGAALVDPHVAEQLRAGTLDRALQSSGFGSAESPTLTAVPSPSGGRRPAPAAKEEPGAPADRRAPADAKAGGAAKPAASVTALAAARERAERERRRQAARDANQEVTRADRAAGTAARAEEAAEQAVQVLEEQLADARDRLTEARAKARRARSAQRQARRALDRMQK